MSCPLPKGGFRVLDDNEIARVNILDTADDHPKGYLVEVSLHFLTYGTEFVLFLAVLENSVLPMR